MLLLLQLSCPERGGRVAERPRWEGGQELVEGLLSKSTYRMSIVKSVIFIANCAGLSQGYISPTTNLKQFGEVKCPSWPSGANNRGMC